MRVRADLRLLRHTRWQGHVVRFVAGGLVTVATGLIAKTMGPVIGGLFLAFPAIFPIGLVTTERLQNREAGPAARGARARRAGICEAIGAAAGCLGLLAFALVLWRGLDAAGHRWPVRLAFAAASVAWAVLAFGGWSVRRPLTHLVSRVLPRASA